MSDIIVRKVRNVPKWKIHVLVEEGHLEITIQPEGIIIDAVNSEGQMGSVMWDSWEELYADGRY